MKKRFKAALAAALALIMALAAIPASALPRFDASAEVEPFWTVPAGYNAHDYDKCVRFLEQTDDKGVKNGKKLNESYDPNDPATWNHEQAFTWIDPPGGGEKRIFGIRLPLSVSRSIIGILDLSGCTALNILDCFDARISEIDVSGCTALTQLRCDRRIPSGGGPYIGGPLTRLDVSGCTALEELYCSMNGLTSLELSSNTALKRLECGNGYLSELDVSNSPALERLDCNYTRISELDLSHNPMLSELYCCKTGLTELDLSDNPLLPLDVIKAEGGGTIGVYADYNHDTDEYRGDVFAYRAEGVYFDGFYKEDGELIASQSESFFPSDDDGYFNNKYYYSYSFSTEAPLPSSRMIARFTDEAHGLAGDINGSGSVSIADAVLTLRLTMYLVDYVENGLDLVLADVDGSGSITTADALLIARMVLGTA